MKLHERFEWLVLALVITAAAEAVPPFASAILRPSFNPIQNLWLNANVGEANIQAAAALLFGLILVTPAPIRAGLVFPKLRKVWLRTIIVCGVAIALTAFFAPKITLPLIRGSDHGYWMWLTGPIARDLVFAGFLYGKFDSVWPGPIARLLPIRRAVVLAAFYFALLHAENFPSMDRTLVCEQIAYTFAGGIALGLTRQWTGSISFVTLTHVIANYIAWRS